ncbi:MAG: GtrA family protein [Myxococcota bacterium]|jgi:dolichol-phosphate mannosyltransferase|nr:GtrA family protein [Myxococcota bacterium]
MRALLTRLDGLIEKLPVSPRFFRFCLVGGSGVVVNLLVLWLLLGVLPGSPDPWRHRVAMAGAIAVSIFTNFVLNDLWTWRDRSGQGAAPWVIRLVRFYLVSSLAATVQWGSGVLLHERLGVWIYLAQALGIVLAMGINFVVNHLWTFRNTHRS